MKKYMFGLFAMALALSFSAFTEIEKAHQNKFCTYIYRYVGPSSCTKAEVENRANWHVKIVTPFTVCMPSVEDRPCSFQTDCVASYLTAIGTDLYKPSTVIAIIAKLSASCPEKYVVDQVEKIADNSEIAISIENIEGCN